MGTALRIREDLSGSDLRRLARKEANRRVMMRMLTIANALDGMSRAEAARVVGMDRQALRDAVVRYNAEGAAAQAPGAVAPKAAAGSSQDRQGCPGAL